MSRNVEEEEISIFKLKDSFQIGEIAEFQITSTFAPFDGLITARSNNKIIKAFTFHSDDIISSNFNLKICVFDYKKL